MDEKKLKAKEFWERFCRADGKVDPAMPYQAWYFGNCQEMALNLGNLVLEGKKRATASLERVNELIPENAPIENGYSVVTDFEGEPICVIQTTEIKHTPFLEVDFDFAEAEGEGDEDIESWRNGHRDYFTKECRGLGFEFDEKMIVACERFKLLYPAERSPGN